MLLFVMGKGEREQAGKPLRRCSPKNRAVEAGTDVAISCMRKERSRAEFLRQQQKIEADANDPNTNADLEI